jgi:hypothetical protein
VFRRHDGDVIRAVFVFEGLDVSVHPAIEDAAAHLEAIDVDNGEYDYFTDDGTVLLGETEDGEVVLRPTQERKPDDLRERLRRHIDYPTVDLDPSLADDPVAFAQAVLDRQWARRWFQWFPWLDRKLHGQGPTVA